MSDDLPLTPNAVVTVLSELSKQLDRAVTALNDADREAVNSREAATLAFANAFLRSEGAMDIRKQKATVDSHAERLKAETDEQIVRGLRRRVDTLKVRIDVGRSLGTALRAELATLGGGA